jgi:hypothetical protein
MFGDVFSAYLLLQVECENFKFLEHLRHSCHKEDLIMPSLVLVLLLIFHFFSSLAAYFLRLIKMAILALEENPTKNAILENRSNYLPN